MNMPQGNLALTAQAEGLMLQALLLLDRARLDLPAAYLQSALDMLPQQSASWTSTRLEREVFPVR